MHKWNACQHSEGVLVAADEAVEWLLPWWWSRYRAHNTYPVVFIDFGLSHFGRAFCSKRGELIPLDLTPNFTSCPNHARHWEASHGKSLWRIRKEWFKKPFAALKTPFEKTLWLDIDCEVLGSIAPLFEVEKQIYLAAETPGAHAIEREKGMIKADEMLYNSGVIVYSHQTPLIEKWAEAVLAEGEEFWSDQHVLSRIIYEEKIPIGPLHQNYNWKMSQGLNLQAVIVHWVGNWGKEYIRHHCGIAHELAQLPKF